MTAELRLPGTVAEIDASPAGPAVGAFFDLDGTLIAGYSARYMSRGDAARRQFSGSELRRALTLLVSDGINEATFAELADMGAAAWRGRAHEDVEEIGLRSFEKHIRERIYPEMSEIVAAHQRRGHTVVLSSSASNYRAEPVAQHLGIEHMVCNRFVTEDGVLTGEMQRPVIWGAQKAEAVQTFAAGQGINLARSYFYADGDDDTALMYLVGNPRPTNPGKRLAQVAEKRGWPVLRFTSRGSSPARLARAVVSMGASLPIIELGVGVGLARQNKRAGINFVFERWLDFMFTASNVHINVIGEENAWAQRPAVFIVNHHTTFDGPVALSVVRRDFTAVAKAEIAQNPVAAAVGRIQDFGYVDRANTAVAVEQLKPIEELAGKGLSVVVAPEGTRTDPRYLGPFKKGAFRIAVAAGLPIVIRKAEVVGGRNAYAMHPGTVDVAVLEPIPVKDWKLEELDQRIAEVRQLFLDTLAHWPSSPAELSAGRR